MQLRATGSHSATIRNTALVYETAPALSAEAATVISGTNHAPVAQDMSLTLSRNKAYNGTLPATDPDGDTLHYAIASYGDHGSIVILDPTQGTYTYSPQHNYVGNDSFTFTASDELTTSPPATVSITLQSPTGSGGSSGGNGGSGGGGAMTIPVLILMAFLGLFASGWRKRRMKQHARKQCSSPYCS